MANNQDLRELYPSSYGQPREKVPGANPWFDQGGKVFGQQLSPKAQNLLGLVAELGLAGGPAVKVSRGATSAIDNLISSDKMLNVANLSKPTLNQGGLLDEFVRKTKARNKKSVENIAKGPTGKELDEARRMTPLDIEKQLRRDKLDKEWYDYVDEEIWHTERSGLAKEFANEKNIHRVPRELRDDLWIQKYLDDVSMEEGPFNLLDLLKSTEIGRYQPRTLTRMLDEINFNRGKLPKIRKPQYYTPSRGAVEEIARKSGTLSPYDADYKDIPAFIRRHIDNDLLR